LPVVEDEEVEEVEAAEDEHARPRKRRRIAARPPPPDEEEDDDRRREIVTWNRIMGVLGVFLGLAFTVGALVLQASGAADVRNPLTTPANAGGCFGLLLGVLLLIVGAIYAIRG